ncbi:MAG TPA: helix-turn-helix domain-containing protein [Vicinamibacterales bacterium]|nr:helix-turn-helix domain-containing protein [Vicinamibacterales bacterium]
MISRTLCPRFHRAIELVGSRWTGAILQLLLAGPARFAELAESIPQISDRMLSERLQVLEKEGLVTRSVLPTAPVRVEYALTAKGRELQRSLDAVAAWAQKWLPDPARATGRRSSRS